MHESNLAMESRCALLLYLDNRRYLNFMKNECVKFLEQLSDKTMCKFPPLRVLLEIDVMDLIDVFPELANLLLTEPMKLQKIFNDILFATLQCIENEKKNIIQYTQVGITVRLTCVPQLLPSNSHKHKGLVTFDGILICFSKPESYVYHSVWSCPEECKSNEVVLHYIPKQPPKCYMCKSVMYENCGFRRCGEKVLATFKLKDQLMPKNLSIVDDLITRLNLGSHYIAYVAVTKHITVVWAIEIIVPIPAPLGSPIPNDIAEIYRACNGVPWQFVYCLASSIGVNVCPLHCFMHLKITVLFSLLSIKGNQITGSNIMHVLVGGLDSRYISDLMIEAAKLADRYVRLGTSNTTSSTALIASSGGICVLPLPLHIYNHKQVSCVLSAIETGEINLELGTTKLKTAVWAQGMDFKKTILFNVSNVFGSICRGDYGEYNDEIADFLLHNAMEPAEISHTEEKYLKDITTYIDIVAGIEVVIDEATEILLQRYFLAARNSRNASKGSMTSLVEICLNSARLCRRRVANIDDAVFAIWLHISGSPEPRFAPEEYLQIPTGVKKLQKIILKFKEWLEQFIDYCV